jgi:hypothetical protein
MIAINVEHIYCPTNSATQFREKSQVELGFFPVGSPRMNISTILNREIPIYSRASML